MILTIHKLLLKTLYKNFEANNKIFKTKLKVTCK